MSTDEIAWIDGKAPAGDYHPDVLLKDAHGTTIRTYQRYPDDCEFLEEILSLSCANSPLIPERHRDVVFVYRGLSSYLSLSTWAPEIRDRRVIIFCADTDEISTPTRIVRSEGLTKGYVVSSGDELRDLLLTTAGAAAWTRPRLRLGGDRSGDRTRASAKPRHAATEDMTASPFAEPEAQGVERHVQFVEQLLDRHSWAPATLEDLRGRLDTIQARLSDPALKLAVVGESSAGKSTFLNAVLGAELLGARITLQTTATATWLRYADTPDLEVEWLDGRRERLSKTRGGAPSEAALAERMDELTTEESIAKRVKSVTLYYPSPVLKPGLAICDTPGSNVENARHTRVAAEAAEACDATLIVNDANVQIPQSLVDFIHRALPADALRRCLCLATKLDTIRGRRRGDEASKAEAVAEVLTTIRRRLRDHLEVEVEVFGCSPQVVLDHRSGEPSGRLSEAQVQAELTRFDEVQRQLWQILERNREQIVSERVLELLSKLFALLPEQLNAQRAKNETQRRELKQRMIPDLEAFAEDAYDKGANTFEETFAIYEGSVDKILNQSFSELEDIVTTPVISAGTSSDLKTISFTLPDHYKAFLEEIKSRQSSELTEKIIRGGEDLLETFVRDFTRHYKELDSLPGATVLRTSKPKPLTSAALGIDPRDFYAGLDEHSDEVVIHTAGAAGTGAVIGTMLLPGVGTVIGGLVGGLFGGAVGSSSALSQQRTGLIRSINRRNDSLFPKIRDALMESVAETIREAFERFQDVIRDHMGAYQARVDEIRAAQAEEDEALARGQATIKADLQRIERRQAELTAALKTRVQLVQR